MGMKFLWGVKERPGPCQQCVFFAEGGCRRSAGLLTAREDQQSRSDSFALEIDGLTVRNAAEEPIVTHVGSFAFCSTG